MVVQAREHRTIHSDSRTGARNFDDLANSLKACRRRRRFRLRAAIIAEAADFVYETLQVRLFVH